jgi:hypothetical protein
MQLIDTSSMCILVYFTTSVRDVYHVFEHVYE